MAMRQHLPGRSKAPESRRTHLTFRTVARSTQMPLRAMEVCRGDNQTGCARAEVRGKRVGPMHTILKRAIAFLLGVVITFLLLPRSVMSQTPAATDAAMVAAKVPSTAAAPALKADAALPTLKEILDHAQ